jgi:hypothetical protein
MAAYLVANSYLGIMPEVTRGTLNTGGTPVYIPVTAPQISPMQTFLRDEALRGSPVMVYDQVQGVRHDEYDAKFYLFADTFPNLVKSILGGTDTVTGAGPYTHNMKLLNNAATGSQPQSYSIMDFDGANYFTLLGAQADSLSISFGAEAAAEATVKFFTNPYTSGTSATSPFSAPSLSTVHMIPAWDTTILVGGTPYTYISDGTLTLARKTAPIFTMGAQAPYQNFAGPIEVTGKFTAVVNSQSDPWSTGSGATALTRSPQSLVIFFTDPNDSSGGTQFSVSFTMTQAQFQNVKRTRGKAYTEVEVEFTANADATDATTGYSPIQANIVNATSTAY